VDSVAALVSGLGWPVMHEEPLHGQMQKRLASYFQWLLSLTPSSSSPSAVLMGHVRYHVGNKKQLGIVDKRQVLFLCSPHVATIVVVELSRDSNRC